MKQIVIWLTLLSSSFSGYAAEHDLLNKSGMYINLISPNFVCSDYNRQRITGNIKVVEGGVFIMPMDKETDKIFTTITTAFSILSMTYRIIDNPIRLIKDLDEVCTQTPDQTLLDGTIRVAQSYGLKG
jgi:hypothetical protein